MCTNFNYLHQGSCARRGPKMRFEGVLRGCQARGEVVLIPVKVDEVKGSSLVLVHIGVIKEGCLVLRMSTQDRTPKSDPDPQLFEIPG